MPTPKSKYSPIWESLKKDKSCRITAPTPLHARIIKAVIKRKDLDLAYKLELGEANSRARLGYARNGSIIRFWLVVTKEITVEDI